MNQMQRTLACGSLFVIGLLAGCGGRQSVASKSAAAFAEAQRNGTPVRGRHEHGGHTALAGSGAEGDPLAKSELDHAASPDMHHARRQSELPPHGGHDK